MDSNHGSNSVSSSTNQCIPAQLEPNESSEGCNNSGLLSQIQGDTVQSDEFNDPEPKTDELVGVNEEYICDSKRQKTLNLSEGSCDDSFRLLYNFKAELETRSPGSIVEIACTRVDDKRRLFNKVFVALRPCIEGFLNGCRPYLVIDSTPLTGKHKGQLAAALGIDGQNGLYPVAYGVFDLETTENWEWFLTHMKSAIGSPPGLSISSDAGKDLGAAVAKVFSECEHRECMRHLMSDFREQFHGPFFAKSVWLAALAYTKERCQFHLNQLEKVSPEAIEYLNNHHKQLWCRSDFSELTKCDYINNNSFECFNSWIKELKSLHVVDVIDEIRRLLMVTFYKRRRVGNKFEGIILPNVIQQMKVKSRSIGEVKISRGNDTCAEVSAMDSEELYRRHVVKLDKKECTCREWQLSGKPCIHAVAFICSLRGSRMDDYVHEYYSVAKFRAAYAGVITPMSDKTRWIKVDPGFEVLPPVMKRPPGRPRKEKIRGCLEFGTRRQQCKKCKRFGHQQRTCKNGVPLEGTSDSTQRKRRK